MLTPELLAHVGRSAPPRKEVVTRRDIRKYAVATGQRLRKYLDGDEAPPLFHIALFWDVVELDELLPDGLSVDALVPTLPLTRAMAGGVNITYHRAVHPGDVLVATRTLTGLQEKMGSQGPLLIYEITTEIETDAGQAVLIEKNSRLLR